MSEKDLESYPEWMRDLIRTTPELPLRKGKGQFSPRAVPVFQGLGGRYYDPNYGLDDLRLMAQRGTGDVPHLQGGTEKFMGPGAGDPTYGSDDEGHVG